MSAPSGGRPTKQGEGLRIVFFAQDDPFYVKHFFDEFLDRHAKPGEIKAVVLSQPLGKLSPLTLARQMHQFYGTLDFLKMGLRYAHRTVMSIRAVRPLEGMRLPRTYSLKQLAMAYGLPVIERNDLNSESFVKMIRRFEADLFISVASPVIFRKNLLATPRLGCINIHNAPLPRYRGMLPTFWQLYHGESQVGITIHRMNSGIDTGDILTQGFLQVLPGESLSEIMVRCKLEGARLMASTLEDFRKGTISGRQMIGEGSYFTFPTKSEALEFRRRGRKLI